MGSQQAGFPYEELELELQHAPCNNNRKLAQKKRRKIE
jgi:hypothetical protein